MKLIKGFLKGLLYVILSPLILVGFAIYAVYSLLLFFYEFIIATIKFFSGSKLTTDLKEDKKVKQLIIEKDKKAKEEQEREENKANFVPQQQPTNTTINNFYITKDQLPIQNMNNVPSIENQQVQSIENKQYLGIEENKGGNEND